MSNIKDILDETVVNEEAKKELSNNKGDDDNE